MNARVAIQMSRHLWAQ